MTEGTAGGHGIGNLLAWRRRPREQAWKPVVYGDPVLFNIGNSNVGVACIRLDDSYWVRDGQDCLK